MAHLGKNVVIVLSLVAAGFFAAWLRFRPYLGTEGRYTDGVRQYDSIVEEPLRYALWDAPEQLPPEVNTDAHESRPALSHDGRWLVFVAGELGLNAELWLAEMRDGRPRDARPLYELNTPEDDLAPAFARDALYFASNRAGGAGGLDLYAAPYADGELGPAVRLEGGLNTRVDETDPAPLPGWAGLPGPGEPPGSAALAFASTRPPPQGAPRRRGFDLYFATPEAGGAWSVEALEALNGPQDEREPAFTADGRTLVFASDRRAGRRAERRDFDLYRSVLDRGEWLAPVPLAGLNTAASERGPAPSLDGFSLLFALEPPPSSGEIGGSDLARARSLELFRRPSQPVGWLDLVILSALLLLALLALLARRWEQLDILYRAFLVSVVAHLFLLWWFRGIRPESRIDDLQPGERTFQVRLARAKAGIAADARERGGELDLTRREDAHDASEPARHQPGQQTEPAAATPAVEEVARAAAPPSEPEPMRALASEPAASEGATEVALRDAERLQPIFVDPAPVLAVSAPPSAREGAAPAAGAAPARTRVVQATEPAGRPQRSEASRLARAGDEPPPAHRSQASATPAEAPGAQVVTVAGPRERFERQVGGAPELELSSQRFDERASLTAVDGPQRGEPWDEPRLDGGGASPRPAGDPALMRAAARPELAGRPKAAAPTFEPAAGPAAPGLALRDPGGADPGARATDAAASSAPVGLLARAGVAVPPERSASGASVARFPGAAAERTQPVERAAAGTPLPRAGARPGAAPTPGATDLGPTAVAPPAALALRGPAAEGELPSGRAADAAPRAGAADLVQAAEFTLAPSRASAEPRPERWRPARAEALPLEAGAALLERSGGRPSAAPRPVEAGLAPGLSRPERAVALRAPGGAERGEGGRATDAADRSSDVTLLARADLAPLPQRAWTGTSPARWRAAEREDDVEARPVPGARPLELPGELAQQAPTPARAGPFEHTPYRTRFGLAKQKALEEHGGSIETEAAVANGLRYLARIQRPEGYWGSVDERDEKYGYQLVGKTGLCLLAFLGAGHTQDSKSEHSRVVRRTIDFLLAVQDEESGHFGYCSSYGHGIATYALAECYALTSDERLSGPLRRAVDQILRNQHVRRGDARRFGGWSYYFPDGHLYQGDDWPRVSISAWQVMALESARLGGLGVPERAFDDARTFLLNAYDGELGAFRYNHMPSRLDSEYPTLPGSTPAALFALSLLGEDITSGPYVEPLRFVTSRAPRRYRYTNERDFVRRAQGNLYFWYYGSLALFRHGDGPWRRWNESMKDTLLPAQQDDGSWEPISVYAEYAKDGPGDRSYTSAMCVLTLEVYYRYFTPLLDVSARRDGARAGAADGAAAGGPAGGSRR